MKINSFLYLLVFFSLFGSDLWGLNIYPDYIKVGETSKEERRTYHLKLENNGEKKITIVGIINQCGLNLRFEKKEILPYKAIEGELSFYAGNVPGRFNEEVKIVYKEGDTLQQKIVKVSWFNKPDYFSKIILANRKIDLGRISQKEIPFYIEVLNTGNALGEVVLEKEGMNIELDRKFEIGASELKFFKGLLTPLKGETKKNISVNKSDISSGREKIELNYEVTDGISIALGRPTEKNDYVELPLLIDADQNYGQILSIKDVNGKNIDFDKSAIKRGRKNIINLKISKDEYQKIKNTPLNINFQLIFRYND